MMAIRIINSVRVNPLCFMSISKLVMDYNKVALRNMSVKGNLVGVEGFELSTSCSQSKRSTKLSYTPIIL